MAKCNLRVHELLPFSLSLCQDQTRAFIISAHRECDFWHAISLKCAYFVKISLRCAFFFVKSQRNLTAWENLSTLKASDGESEGGKVGHVGYSVWKPVQAASFDWWSFTFLGLKCTKMEKARSSLRPYFILMLSLKRNVSCVCLLEAAAPELMVK